MKYVNTKIVNALLTLRGVSRDALCSVTGLSPDALCAWLDGVEQKEEDKTDDERLPFERQLEVLKVLGITGDHPRSDVVHHWTIREPVFGHREKAYEPLRHLLSCFGRAEVVHLALDQDSLVSLTSRTYFLLTFMKFRVILAIETAPFQSISFNPETLPNLNWAGTGATIVTSYEKFQQLTAPGEVTPGVIDQERFAALEHFQWTKLTHIATERGVAVADIAKLILERQPLKPALPASKKPAIKSRKRHITKNAARSRPAKAEDPALSTVETAPQAVDG